MMPIIYRITFYQNMKLPKQLLEIGVIFLSAFLSSAQCFAETVEELFARFEKEEFFPLKSTNGAVVVSGWEMESNNGKTYHRAVLNRQVEEVVKLGKDAVPVLLDRLNHPHMHLRYIAAESLSRITGRDPIWYSFGTPNETFNGNKTWSKDAIQEWKAWYEEAVKEDEEVGEKK